MAKKKKTAKPESQFVRVKALFHAMVGYNSRYGYYEEYLDIRDIEKWIPRKSPSAVGFSEAKTCAKANSHINGAFAYN
jgi:hypothetical protein